MPFQVHGLLAGEWRPPGQHGLAPTAGLPLRRRGHGTLARGKVLRDGEGDRYVFVLTPDLIGIPLGDIQPNQIIQQNWL